jgi:sterol desaturase/sphingolipid hydroxylase (fatty acid hydroxylase superfamily)
MIELTQNSWAILIPFILFAVMALIEMRHPRHKLVFRQQRWITHTGFFIVNLGMGRLLSLLSVSSAAAYATQYNWGLFAVFNAPFWLELIAALIIYDFAVWAQHRAMHKIPFLWRAHQVHHSDRELDVSTALRFHPFELIISMLYKSLIIMALGIPIWIAIILELWLNINALFNHSNVKLPNWLDRLLRPILVTPDMHLVHHSIAVGEQQSNFGFGLSIWDRMAGSYLPQSAMGKNAEIIGLKSSQNESPTKWGWSMLQPFRPVE